MNKSYYLNKNAQATGEHEVHTSDCRYLPIVANKIYLGVFDNSEDAIRKARLYYHNVDGCRFCCPKSHKR